MEKVKQIATIVISLFSIVLCVLSCNTERKAAKKTEAAYQRVLTDSSAAKRLYNALRPVYEKPCINDTLPGETEILILSDTQYIRSIDTLVEFMPDTVKITVTKTNTVTKYVIDNRAINELSDSLASRNVRIAELSGRITQLELEAVKQAENTETQRKRGDKWFWLFIGACVTTVAAFISRFAKFRI